jgi:hypothetical protein
MEKDDKLKKKLMLYILDYINLTTCCSSIDFPNVKNYDVIKPDYIALYNEKGLYHYSKNTIVSFYNYDNVFDGNKGLYESIRTNNHKEIFKFIERFNGIKYFIEPDYSQCGDINNIINIINIFKARIVSIWLSMTFNAIVIPNITYASRDMFDFMVLGLDECEVVAMSTKGSMNNYDEKKLFKDVIKYTVDNLTNLKRIIVYTTSTNQSQIGNLFQYAKDKGVEISVPKNTLLERNKVLMYGKN